MKKTIIFLGSLLMILLLTSNQSMAQNDPDIGKIIKNQFNKYFSWTGDAQLSNDEALKVRKRLKDGSGDGDCTGFVDEDGDGICDNCGFTDGNGDGVCDGTGELDRLRDRDSEGSGLKKRNGN